MKISKDNTNRYVWGEECVGWHLLRTDSLSVILEEMLPGTEEVCHKHDLSQQLFFVVKGELTLELDGKNHPIYPNEAFHVPAGIYHKVRNLSRESCEFLLISEPNVKGDKVLINSSKAES